ncbi:hypothetical protein [Hirschia litorea]|uniref:Uncharacterized protein n=1 Tax=Hirschia litorea TaxID=1199156 RepID=A0ABW2IK27_9PROT
MSTSNAIDDLGYLRSLAEEGATAPNVNGRYYITFGCLGAIALTAHWSIASGVIGLPLSTLAFVWLGFALLSPIAIFLLSRSSHSKPGQGSASNRVTRLFWTTASPAMFSIWIALSVAAYFRNVSPIVFDMLPIIAFFSYGVVYMIEAGMEKASWKRFAGLGGIAGAVTMAALIGTAEAYLGGAIATLLIGVIPGSIMMKREPKNVV